ncbi:MAG: sugar ABC transporter permease [Coleofasciculaceae cyanobacterium RL_1_1]|nr:sugar ABC transporter permease [Coleofasciculaceae cyanobacterium RL_1_1]
MEHRSFDHHDRRIAILFLSPALLLLLGVYGYPIARSLGMSFFAENLGTQLQPVFYGLGNYGRMMGDGRFWQSLGNTTVFTLASVVIELVLGLAIAMVLNRAFIGRGLVRTIAILPWALPTAVMAVGWGWIFNDQYGVVNDILQRLHLIDSGINWLGNPTLAMISLVIADVWKTTSFVSILLLAGLQSIPSDLYEAHAMDGATPWQSFTQITLPLLVPQIAIAVLFRFAQSFGVFDLVQVMTGGGPAGSTEMVSLYIYSMVMRYLDFGYGAALTVVTFVLLIAVVLCVAWLLQKRGINLVNR